MVLQQFQIDGLTGKKLTADVVRANSIRLAKSLQLKFGVKEGDVIGLCSENRLEFPVIVFAALYLGATIAPLNVTYSKRKHSVLRFVIHGYFEVTFDDVFHR